jgi:hypothetical protein
MESSRASRRIACGGWPQARRNPRRMRSWSAKRIAPDRLAEFDEKWSKR